MQAPTVFPLGFGPTAIQTRFAPRNYVASAASFAPVMFAQEKCVHKFFRSGGRCASYTVVVLGLTLEGGRGLGSRERYSTAIIPNTMQ